MNKTIIVIFILILLPGCNNLTNFTTPNDIHFLECIAKLDTVPKIAIYMQDNFTYQVTMFTVNPHEMWLRGIGDCDGYAVFGVYAAQQNNIEAYQVIVWYTNENVHINAVYKVNDYWVLTDCWVYHERFTSIDEAIRWHSDYCKRILIKYEILGEEKWSN